MKTMIEKWKKLVSFWKFYLEVSALDHGTNRRFTPRFLRRMLAGTRYHKAWMWGRMTPCAKPQSYLQAKVRFWKKRMDIKLFWLEVSCRQWFWRMLVGIQQTAFAQGIMRSTTPRSVRKLLAGSNIHRTWLRGRMTHSVDVEGNCAAAGEHMLPFKSPTSYF